MTVPATRSGAYAGLALVFLPAMGDFISAQLLGGPDNLMIGNLIQDKFFAGQNWPLGAALTMALMVLLLICMFAYLRQTARDAKEAATMKGSGMNRKPRFAIAVTVLFFVLLYLPIVAVVLFSFNNKKSLTVFEGWSLRWYQAFLDDAELTKSLETSLVVAAVAMVGSVVIGVMLAFGLVRARSRIGRAANVIMLIPLITPEIVTGVASLMLFKGVWHAAVADHPGDRADDVLHLLCHGDPAGAGRGTEPRGRAGGNGSRREQASGAATGDAARHVRRPSCRRPS